MCVEDAEEGWGRRYQGGFLVGGCQVNLGAGPAMRTLSALMSHVVPRD